MTITTKNVSLQNSVNIGTTESYKREHVGRRIREKNKEKEIK